MKKFLSVFFAACVASTALMGGLAIVPHVHEHDFDHSQHKTCPVYQVGLHSNDAVVVASAAIVVFFVFAFFSVREFVSASRSALFSALLRAPPAVS